MSNGSGFLVSSENVLMSAFGLSVEYAAPSDLRGGCSPAVVVHLCNELTDNSCCRVLPFSLLLYCKTLVKTQQ